MTKTDIGFKALTEQLRSRDLVIPAGWRQGRTAYGGLTAGLCLSEVLHAHPDLPPLRTAQITFVGPVSESPVFETRLLRRGRNVISFEVTAKNDEDVCAVAVFMFGAGRPSGIAKTLSPPKGPAPKDLPAFIPPQAKNFVPVFFHRFDTRLIEGARPMTGADRGYIRCWSRHVDEASRSGIEAFMALGDVLPPAAAPLMKAPAPISSMNWQINILVDDVDSEDGWYMVETDLSAAADGYSTQIMRFWDLSGRLVAEGIQSVAIFA